MRQQGPPIKHGATKHRKKSERKKGERTVRKITRYKKRAFVVVGTTVIIQTPYRAVIKSKCKFFYDVIVFRELCAICQAFAE